MKYGPDGACLSNVDAIGRENTSKRWKKCSTLTKKRGIFKFMHQHAALCIGNLHLVRRSGRDQTGSLFGVDVWTR